MLKKYRSEIDKIDDEIIKLLAQRDSVVLKVKEYKQINNIEVLDQGREDFIIDKINNTQYDNKEDILKIYELIMELSKGRQR